MLTLVGFIIVKQNIYYISKLVHWRSIDQNVCEAGNIFGVFIFKLIVYLIVINSRYLVNGFFSIAKVLLEGKLLS